MNKTSIEYVTHSWNPIAMRCSRVSPGCDNCWHLRMADRMAKNPQFDTPERQAYAGGRPTLLKSRLNSILKIKKPHRVAVQLMGDLFHESIDMEWVFTVFDRMWRVPHVTFIVCTKRPERAYQFCKEYGLLPSYLPSPACTTPSGVEWPANVWFLATVENQEWANKRIPWVLRVPAPIRGVSIEPMLGDIELDVIRAPENDDAGASTIYPFAGTRTDMGRPCRPTGSLNWVICGGESGPGARPMHSGWVRSLRNQCQRAGVPFFFKQWGEYIPADQNECPKGPPSRDWLRITSGAGSPAKLVRKVGKKVAGRLLDGQEYNQFPEVKR